MQLLINTLFVTEKDSSAAYSVQPLEGKAIQVYKL